MVNMSAKPNEGAAAERRLALGYAPAALRPALEALFALDAALGPVLQTTRQAMAGQLRLAWWRDALVRLDTGPPPAEPVLQVLAREVVPRGVMGASLAGLVDGWEELLLADGADEAALRRYGVGRGRLFELAGALLGVGDDPVAAAGQGWALADLATHSGDAALAESARRFAGPLLDQALARRWSVAGRPLGAIAQLARLDLAVAPGTVPPHGAPSRVWRLLRHRLTGR